MSLSIRYGKQKTCFYDEQEEVKLTASEVYCYPNFKLDRLFVEFALVKLRTPIPVEMAEMLPPQCLAKDKQR